VGGGPHRPGLIPPDASPALPRRPAILVAGPTASGKSALGLAIARAFGGVVVNADSMQVYRELRILTARPGAEELAAAPHALYGVLSAAERCSAGRWRQMAEAAAHATDLLPVFVGGTGLYLRTLSRGLAEIPPVPEPVFAEGAARLARLGAPGLHGELAAVDPATAARLSPGDSQRILRAWTVWRATGRSLAEWQQAAPVESPWTTLCLALMPARPALYAACDARFLRMVEQGAMEEVAGLLALGLEPSLPALRAVGVRELGAVLAGQAPLSRAVAAAQQATRRYAKRQATWIRHQMPDARVIEAQFSERILPEIFTIIRHFLLTVPA
jgi:tRNA dimethylallyltransferase